MIKVIWPAYISLTDWAAALLQDYPDENLPILQDEESWEDWGNIVANSGIFARAAIPMPTSIKSGEIKKNFQTWDKWAEIVYTIMADEYNLPKSSTV
jgi:hypothetical protein